MAMTEHTAKAFDVDLQELTRMVAEMGGLAEKQVADAVGALARRDAERAKRVLAMDASVDALQQEIEEKAVLTIARRQPMAVDLREVVSALRIANDLERIGDLAKNIAKRVALTGDFHPQKLIRGVEHMAAMVLGQLKEVLDSYGGHDLVKAMMVWKGDEEIDAMCTSLFRELITYMMEDPRNITFCIHLMFSAKNIERMGDHATNIAETVYFMIEGRPIADQRPKGDTTTSPASKSDEEPERMKPNILIVEDEEALTDVLRYNLEAEGYEVETVARGDEADVRLRSACPTWSSSTGCCRACPASSCAGGCGRARRPGNCRSSCSRRAARRASACAGLRPAPTTTSSSRSRFPN